MNTIIARPAKIDADPTAVVVEVTDDALRLVLSDGRELSAPLAWFPRLRDATQAARQALKTRSASTSALGGLLRYLVGKGSGSGK